MGKISCLILLALSVHLSKEQDAVEAMLKNVEKMYDSVAQRSPRFLFGHYYTYRQDTPVYTKPQMAPEEVFDFIVVGSGSAGSALASRLSENPKWKILLVEVGEEATVLTDIPAIAPAFQFTNYNWGYLMEKQENMCLGLEDQRMAWPRGRAIGGSSVINYMIHVRGNKHDYDKWASQGNPGWSYRDVLPYFKKLEDSLIFNQDPEFHSKDGPISVRDVPSRSEAANAFIQGAQQAGHKYVDYNGGSQLGVSYVQANLKRGRRCSVEKAYLRPTLFRPNIKILSKSRATRVLIDKNSRKAIGIEYVRNRKYHIAKASKEVILSAGAFNSPQLLMLSGIGPKDHLQELGIPLVQDLPVGKKMFDHLTFLGLSFTLNESIVLMQSDLENPNSFLELLAHGTGPLTTIGGVEALVYLKTKASVDPEPDYPDMELIFVGGSFNTDKGLIYRKSFRISEEVYNKVWRPLEGKPVFMVLPMLIHPKSVGHLKLKSKNPYHWPKFFGNCFTDPEGKDIKTFIAAIREVQKIVESPSLQKYGAKIVSTPIPGCERHVFDSDPYWECALRHVTGTLHHQVATCKMGPSNDKEAVVDHKLQVYGVKNLRVADTSIIPLPLSAHTNVPAIMVGERAADLIKEDWERNERLVDAVDIRRHAIY